MGKILIINSCCDCCFIKWECNIAEYICTHNYVFMHNIINKRHEIPSWCPLCDIDECIKRVGDTWKGVDADKFVRKLRGKK